MAWTRWGRRREALDQPFPDAWRHLLAARMAHWSMLDDAEQAEMEDLIRFFLADKRFDGSHGFELTEEVRVLVGAMACLLILGLDYDCYHKVDWIVLHPSTIRPTDVRGTGVDGVLTDDAFPMLGQTLFDGPVTIAWDAAAEGARHPERGHNVVYHEFAHKIDMADGIVDGTPPLEDAAERQRWIEVCTREFDAVRAGAADSLLDPYAGVNPGEFFAVATELFFDRPVDLQHHHGDLYDVLAGFYRQDTAARQRRADRTAPVNPGAGGTGASSDRGTSPASARRSRSGRVADPGA